MAFLSGRDGTHRILKEINTLQDYLASRHEACHSGGLLQKEGVGNLHDGGEGRTQRGKESKT